MDTYDRTIAFFAAEGHAILQAPAVFITALVILGLGIWATLNWLYSGQIANLESTIKLKEANIADYKDKLSGASPDEAKKRLDALELAVSALSPRRLTEDQKSRVVRAIGGSKAVIAITADMGVGDARAYVRDFALAFQSGGWEVQLPQVMGIGNPPLTGLALRVADVGRLTEAERTLKDALEAIQVRFDIQEGKISKLSPFPHAPVSPDAELLVSSRLEG